MQMNIVDIESYLSSVETRPSSTGGKPVSDALAALKASAVVVNDEVTAKKLWCFETALSAQEHYLQAFSMMRDGRFYDAWCKLEHAELDLRFLERHKGEWWNTFELDFIQAAVARWQGLFPYKLFLSPELIEKEKKCSVCGKVVAPRHPCGHSLGEVYAGSMCVHVVTQLEPLGVSFVEDPVQKYSVPFMTDPKTGKSYDHYNYKVVQYAITVIRNPFKEWSVERTTRLQPHSLFRGTGRNDPCPCESGMKYKKCCLPKKGVVCPHLQFHLSTPVSSELIS